MIAHPGPGIGFHKRFMWQIIILPTLYIGQMFLTTNWLLGTTVHTRLSGLSSCELISGTSEYLNLTTSCNEDSGTLNCRLLLDSCENLSFIDSILEITTHVRLTGLSSCEQCSIASVNLNTCGGSGISLILMSPFNFVAVT